MFETEKKNWLNGLDVPVYGSTNDNDAADTEVRLKYQWVDPTGSDGPREYKREKQSTYGTSSETFFDADGHVTAVSFSHNRNDGTYSGTNFINYETDMSGQITYRYEGGTGSGVANINGETHHLWRAVDHEGEVLESYVAKKRDKKAALKLLRKALRRQGQAEKIATDGLKSYPSAMRELGIEDRRGMGRWQNNRAENSRLPFRRRERVM